eukprot:m.75319 g.75319  ORF g.75319 m.75319 type:complete len:99 (-) comp12447_c1_seq1:117-413(-)
MHAHTLLLTTSHSLTLFLHLFTLSLCTLSHQQPLVLCSWCDFQSESYALHPSPITLVFLHGLSYISFKKIIFFSFTTLLGSKVMEEELGTSLAATVKA